MKRVAKDAAMAMANEDKPFSARLYGRDIKSGTRGVYKRQVTLVSCGSDRRNRWQYHCLLNVVRVVFFFVFASVVALNDDISFRKFGAHSSGRLRNVRKLRGIEERV